MRKRNVKWRVFLIEISREPEGVSEMRGALLRVGLNLERLVNGKIIKAKISLLEGV